MPDHAWSSAIVAFWCPQDKRIFRMYFPAVSDSIRISFLSAGHTVSGDYSGWLPDIFKITYNPDVPCSAGMPQKLPLNSSHSRPQGSGYKNQGWFREMRRAALTRFKINSPSHAFQGAYHALQGISCPSGCKIGSADHRNDFLTLPE